MDEWHTRSPAIQEETFESIPWDSLLRDPRRKEWMVMAGGLVVVVMVAALVARLAWGTPDYGPTEPLLMEPVTTTVPAELVTEAQLYANDPLATAQVSGATAWFLREFFTVDAASHRDALGLARPSPDGATSYVDSVDVFAVAQVADGVFAVTAVVRRLESVDSAGFRRLPPLGVRVLLSMTEDGFEVVDLPSPVDVPEAVVAPPIGDSDDDPPAGVRAAALRVLSRIGEVDTASMVFHRFGDRWRAEADVQDPAGMRWGVAAWFTAEGEEALPAL